MLFNTWSFLWFFLVVFLSYYLVRRQKLQIILLTVASFVFYAWGNPWLVFLLLGSTWINAYAILTLLKSDANERRRWWIVTGAVVVNLLILGFFKYAALFASTVLPPHLWARWGAGISNIPLPIGVSFFTFQSISLILDIYRAGPEGIPGLRKPQSGSEERSLYGRIFFYNAFFPCLIAGPIVKAHEFMHQIGAKYFRDIDWHDVFSKLAVGFFLKMVVADNLKDVTLAIEYPNFIGLPGWYLILLLYAFSVQIFADFCGYSLIAMGIAKCFNYELPINFSYPYISGSITEFWRRWHISLSTWLKQYLYFPLGGNRKGAVRTYVNLFLVMLIGGLWHGAAWSYLIWGGAHGLLLAAERFIGVRGESVRFDGGWLSRAMAVVRIFLIFNIVSFLWLFFKLPEFTHVGQYLAEIAKGQSGFPLQATYVILFFSVPVLLYHLYGFAREHFEAPSRFIVEPFAWPRVAVIAMLIFFIISNSGTTGLFVYFQF